MSDFFTNETLTTIHTEGAQEPNEFTQIEGLGTAMQRWLRKSLNVCTVAELAKLSVTQVLSRLGEEERTFGPCQLENWIQQAQQVVRQHTPWQTVVTFVVSLQVREVNGQPEQRTIAYCLEVDRKQIWSGVECNGVYELMLEQLKHVVQWGPEVSVPRVPEPQRESKLQNSNPAATEP